MLNVLAAQGVTPIDKWSTIPYATSNLLGGADFSLVLSAMAAISLVVFLIARLAFKKFTKNTNSPENAIAAGVFCFMVMLGSFAYLSSQATAAANVKNRENIANTIQQNYGIKIVDYPPGEAILGEFNGKKDGKTMRCYVESRGNEIADGKDYTSITLRPSCS